MPDNEIIIKHDGEFDIATGRSRKELNWRNKEMLWSDFLKKLSETHRTSETYQEYLSSKKPRQDELKDVGGFVGGYLNNGRRKPSNVLHRQLITLDIDFAHATMWDDFTMLYSNAAVLYSTHKHSSDLPRYRLVLPLDRHVFADEYIAISRRVAGMLGIDYFDDTTFQPERLMYWPSTSKDGEYVFEYQDGAWISADELLGSYHNWKDTSEWPVSVRVDKVVQRGIAKQGDPLEKSGIVGAFCRTYSIEEAIETYLPDTYDACDIENRYTYKEGSTSGGLIVYESKYTYSHHGTDPSSGKLCNAFDLVRIHKFGLKDEDAKEDTPGNKLPSYIAMCEFATKDKKVRKLVVEEKLHDAKSDFEEKVELMEGEEVDDTDWLSELDVDRNRKVLSTINNIMLILTHDPKLKGKLALDTFAHREIALGNLPWRKVDAGTSYMTDTDDAGIRYYLENTYGVTGAQKIQDATLLVHLKNSFHPVREYLENLEWDGVERCDTLFIDYMGVEDSEYTRAVTRKMLVGAIARIYQPGVKFDYVLTMVGEEGKNKSEIISRLGGKWFSDSFNTLEGKEAFEQLQGVWIIEMAELSALKNAQVEAVKHFVAKRSDRYRVAYGRRVEEFQRQCIFIGSTNKLNFLKGINGDRRFWPLLIWFMKPTKDVHKDLTPSEVAQIWAEAIEYYHSKEPLYLDPRLEAMAREKQAEHSEQDDRTGLIQAYLDRLLPENWKDLDICERRSWLTGNAEDDIQKEGEYQRNSVCIPELWCELFGGQLKDMTRFNVSDLHACMRNLRGWSEHRSKVRFSIYGVQKAYVRESAKGETQPKKKLNNSVADDFK